jgi:cytochrome c oxidase assembly protein subunit 11
MRLRAKSRGRPHNNVSPPTVGAYFSKINCFCFTEQRLKAGETREMTVVFYVDPSLVKDSDQADLNTITLSYTFYRLRELDQPVAEAPKKNSSRL